MTLNPGLLNPYQGMNPYAGYAGGFGQQFGQPGGIGLGPVPAAYGNVAQGNGGNFGLNLPVQGLSQIEDIADDIAERVADEIADQAASGAAALYQAQVPQAAGQSVGGLNVKRWLNATRITDTLRDQVKQSAQQLARHAVGQLLNTIQSQWPAAGQFQHQFGQPQFAAHPFGALGGLQTQGVAAYGAGNQGLGNQGLGQQNVAQLAPVVAAILSILQQSQGMGQGQFGGQNRLI